MGSSTRTRSRRRIIRFSFKVTRMGSWTLYKVHERDDEVLRSEGSNPWSQINHLEHNMIMFQVSNMCFLEVLTESR